MKNLVIINNIVINLNNIIDLFHDDDKKCIIITTKEKRIGINNIGKEKYQKLLETLEIHGALNIDKNFPE